MLKIAFIVLIANFYLFSQDSDLDKLPYDDTPVQEQSKNYFVIGGGYSLGYNMINVDAYNKLLKNQFGLSEMSGGIVMHGGVGFTGIPFIENFRVGIQSAGGSQLNTKNEGGYTLEQSLSLKMTSINFDYGYIITNHLALLMGADIGWGNSNLSLIKSNANTNWVDISPNLDTNSYNYSIEKNFMYLKPKVSVEWAATSFLMFRLMAAYNLTFDNPFSSEIDKAWRLNKLTTISNTPNGLSNSGIYFEFGVFLGLFNY